MSKALRIEKSRELYEEAKQILAAGASSNLRVYPMFRPHPIYMDRGKGSRMWDIDGNEYIDYLNAFGALILGHCNPKVNEAVKNQLEKGTMFGTVYELEVRTAKKLREMVPSVEMLRFCCSGTEATMSTLRIARGFTGKDKIIRFEGQYHGHHDYVLVSYQPDPSAWGSRTAPNKIPMSPGIPEDTLKSVIPLPWNDLGILEKTVKRRGHEIAAIITEPVMGNGGMIFPQKGFLEGMRELTAENEIVLIFDEVVTGFRLARGGAAEYFGVKPDLHTFAKAMANGYPIAAFGGRRDIMENVGPGKILHAGTYAANPLSLAAAEATLNELDKDKGAAYERLRAIGTKLVKGLGDAAEKAGQEVFIPGFAGFFMMYFTRKKMFKDWRDVKPNVDPEKYERFAWEMYRRGIYLHPDTLERVNVSMVHDKEDIERTVAAAEEAFRAIR